MTLRFVSSSAAEFLGRALRRSLEQYLLTQANFKVKINVTVQDSY